MLRILQQVDTSNLSLHPTSANVPFLGEISSTLGAPKSLNVSASSLGLADSYTIALWSYCADNGGASSSNTSCSTPTKDFWFDPVKAWHLNKTIFADELPKAFNDVLKTYHSVSKGLVGLYLIAISATAASTILGFCAVFSLVGSILPLIITAIATVGLLAASIMATVAYSSVVGTFDTVLRSYGVGATLGLNMFALTWSAFLSTLLSSFLWLLRGLCCCCGKRK
jgi:SUR7/PalI family protein